jgi:hypothetical protein
MKNVAATSGQTVKLAIFFGGESEEKESMEGRTGLN